MSNSKPKLMWIATERRGGWIPAPATGLDVSEVGYSESVSYLNGGVFLRRSSGSHKEYQLKWNAQSRDFVRQLTDLSSGLWGKGLVYFLDPTAMDKNLLPQFMASPMLGAEGGPLLIGEDEPALIETPFNPNNYPVDMAQYGAGTTRYRHYLPIPPGYVAWVGTHGTTTAGYMRVERRGLTGSVLGTDTVEMQSVQDTNRFSRSYSSVNHSGLYIYLDNNTTYAGAMVQLLKIGETPKTGGFISGQGNSGCEFSSPPTQNVLSVALDRVEASATLIEVGGWV